MALTIAPWHAGIDLSIASLAIYLLCKLIHIFFRFVLKSKLSQPSVSRFSPPCETVVESAERSNQFHGHENLGFLSKKAAFSPLVPPLKSLPTHYDCWDQIAASLAFLIQSGTLRETLDRMPVLHADSQETLPESCLQRAATLLGILAHSYVRLEGSISLTAKHENHHGVIPPSLYIPWSQVCHRLGRTSVSLTYIDLVVYNFMPSDRSLMQSMLEKPEVELLVPTVNNQEERTFYGTMIEINSQVVPIFNQVIEAQRAAIQDDTTGLKVSLKTMILLLEQVTATFRKISMRESSKTYVDPVVWTKTVANLAIPWLKDVTGAAGTAHPFFHMMDEFLDRKAYDSRIGKEAKAIRSTYPIHWQRFLSALGEVSVRDFIKQLSGREKVELDTLWTSLEYTYGGDQGLLGIHRRKVYGFLSVSFRIGRNSTINGLGPATVRAKWTEADRELEKARQERNFTERALKGSRVSQQPDAIFHFSDLIQHNNQERGYWFVNGDQVFDASTYMDTHPGGKTLIALCSGQDATNDLKAVAHLTNPKILGILQRHCVGVFHRKLFSSCELQDLYDQTAWLGQKLAEMENIHRASLSCLYAKMTIEDRPDQLTAQKTQHIYQIKAKMHNEHKSALATLVSGLLRCFDKTQSCYIAKACSALSNTNAGLSTPSNTVELTSCEAARAWLELDFRHLQAMKVLTTEALRELENLPFDAHELLDLQRVAVVEKLAVITNHVLQLGE